MDVVFFGFDRFWFDYLAQLLPSNALPQWNNAESASAAGGPEAVLIVDRLDQVPEKAQPQMDLAAQIMLLSRPGEAVPSLPEWLNSFRHKITLICLDNALAPPPETSLKAKPLICGVSPEGPFRIHSFKAEEPFTVGFVSSAEYSPISTLSNPQLNLKVIRPGMNTSLESLVSEINHCDIIIEDLKPGSLPGLTSWLALAQGRTVVCDLAALNRSALPASEQLLPLIDARSTTLEKTLESLVRDPRTLRDLHRRGIEFVRSYRRLDLSRAQMARVFGR